MTLTLGQLANQLGARPLGPDERDKSSGFLSKQITGVRPLQTADENEITFVSDDKHIAALAGSRAGAVIVPYHIHDLDKPQLLVENVNAALIETLKIFAPQLKAAPPGIDPTARVGKNVRIADDVSVGACVVIDDGAQIGQNTVIATGCKIGENSKIGGNCRLDCNVVIYHNCRIGNNVSIQANTTIGSTGFGYSIIDGEPMLIPHNGGVIIEDFVEIGANCCVDRAKFDNTIIGAGTKTDNLVQIAHNVVIGKCCLIAAQTGIGGSCRIGDSVVLGGQVGLRDNIEIGDGAMIAAQSGVGQNVAAGQAVFGSPAIDKKEEFRIISARRHLPDMAKQIKHLIKRVERLEASENDKE
jgi:UDP-3-O-[3-hydroxymyristoyl] glucosamine N-acyltransferase